MKNIIVIIFLRFALPQCDGFNWHHNINIDDCNQKDIQVLNEFIKNSQTNLNPDLDVNFNSIIEPLELGWQLWEEGRLIHWICNDVLSPFYFYNYNCGLSGEIPKSINKLDSIVKLHINHNNLQGQIPESICELDISSKSNYWFKINDNYLCPPYPDCVNMRNIYQHQLLCD